MTWEGVRGKKHALERLGSLDDLERGDEAPTRGGTAHILTWLPLMYARGVFSGQALLSTTTTCAIPQSNPRTSRRPSPGERCDVLTKV